MITAHWRRIVSGIKAELTVWQRVSKHPNTPSAARWLLGLALLYLVSPIDLIPDWIPLLGQLDDLIVVPLLIRLALRYIPQAVIEDCRRTEHDNANA